MIETISLCPICYKKIPAFIGPRNNEAWMIKECDVHGKFEAMCERSWIHWSNFYRMGTMGNNKSIIVHINNGCNMKCPWCYYGGEKIHTPEFIDMLLYEPYKGFSLMFSGGEPTEKPGYHEYVALAYLKGWNPSTITNMINLADNNFFNKTLNEAWCSPQGDYRFALSYQHPKNYSSDILKAKEKALENIASKGLKASCVMFSISDLDEIDFIREFYDRTRHLYHMLRIRTLFHSWKNKSEKKLFQSDLHAAFMEKFADYTPVQSSRIEQSTAYGMYLMTKECRDISLMSPPTVENLDYHLASRPVYMLGQDMRCYPVPIAQIIAEGIEQGYKDGFKIGGA